MSRVLNKYKDVIPSDAIYVGRPSKYGNPFTIGRDGDRDEVINKYVHWIVLQPKLIELIKQDLKGKDLVCFCAPLACHGDILKLITEQD